ncbi:MAG: hypothetical protein R3E56_11390 [Burkholderiaceae bacterium]
MTTSSTALFASSTRRRALGALACLTLSWVLPAHALGRLGDVQVIDRDTSETLPVYRHRGEYWVAGRPGARYAVSIQNRQSARLLGVVSVDGINAISGEKAGFNQTGYVLDPWQSYRVTGWRKSDDEVAAFHFTASPASYAERTGRPEQVGVIGVALFRERVDPPAVSVPDSRYREAPESPRFERQQAPAPSPSAAAKRGAAADAMAESAAAPRLGTGHGAREIDSIGHTTFERRSARPDEIVRIRYDSRENLIAMGVIPARAVPPRPNPFPGGSNRGYAPDPY